MIKLKGILTIKLNNMVNLSKLRYNVGCSYIIPDKINQKIPSSVFFNVRDYLDKPLFSELKFGISNPVFTSWYSSGRNKISFSANMKNIIINQINEYEK